MTVIEIANMVENMFPSIVVLTKIVNKYFTDIL